MKRNRIDGQLSKQEYDEDHDNMPALHPGEFSRATPNTLASRKFLTANREDKKIEFGRHLKALNSSFHQWFAQQTVIDSCADLLNGVQDYIDYASQLEDRYLRSYGEVLTFGSGDCGQLAHGMEDDNDLMVRFPRIVYSLREKKVCGIACGGLHNAVWTETGQVFTWGCSDSGSLGREGDEYTPTLVQALIDADETIIGIACGDNQTVVVSTSGSVWGWGSYTDKEGKKFFNPSKNAKTQVGDIKKQQNTPLLIQGLSNAVEVACGAAFNLALCGDGAVYSWGVGECGELAHAKNIPLKKQPLGGGEAEYDLEGILMHHITPTPMHRYKDDTCTSTVPVTDAKAIGCGAYHSLIVCLADSGGGGGSVLSAGLNNYAQLGLGPKSSSDKQGDTESRSYLSRIQSLEGLGVVSVKGGVHHSVVLTSKGEILAFGRGDSGQLGVPMKEGEGGLDKAGGFSASLVSPILQPPAGSNSSSSSLAVVSIACGGNHNLAITASNDVYTWGYGDMLALGHGVDKDEPLPKRINFGKTKIGGTINVTQVAGGGQHSAIIGRVFTV